METIFDSTVSVSAREEALSIIREICDKYSLPLINKFSYYVTDKDWPRGMYVLDTKTVRIAHNDPNFGLRTKQVLVHEMAHYVDLTINGITKSAGGRNMWHGDSFRKVVFELYQMYDLFDEALKKRHEYVGVQKYIKKRLGI